MLADLDAEAHLARARLALRNAVAVVPHPGADGLAAAALGLRARNERASAAVLLDSDPFAPGAPIPDGPLAIIDWGIRAIDRPVLLVDHTMPEVAPRDDQVFVSGYGEIPIIPSAALLRRLVRESPLWLAEIGIATEIGAEHVSHDARQLAALADAPRRVPDGPVRTALEVLTAHDDIVDALADHRVAELDDARRTWKAAVDRVMRTVEPEHHGDVSVVRFDSECVLEDVVARSWALRLPGSQVIAVRNGVHVGGQAARLPQERLARLLRSRP
ncbi:MAG: single-stranded-DNA-specific exonuclease [Solirubrobacteraceae bacterium]|nr:single-stranded-DNA-specific exonuclease [Solirubrobacteraceae bacterium]